VALACEVVSEDHITRSKTARGAIADPDFHLPHKNKNVLSPGRGVPIAPIVRRETAEHEVGTRLKRNVVAPSAGRGRSSKWVWPSWPAYIRTIMRVLPPREIIVHAYLSEDEGVVSNRFGPGPTTRFTKAARREYRFSRITPFRIAQVPVGQQQPAEMAWRCFAIQDVTRSGLAAAAP
jgi:hypothetical protein